MLRSGHERSIWISKYSSVPCSRRQLEPVVGIHLNTDASLCINYCTEMHYTRQNFGLQYWSLFVMECHHDVIPVPSPARPPFRVFLSTKNKQKNYQSQANMTIKMIMQRKVNMIHPMASSWRPHTTQLFTTIHCTALHPHQQLQ